jgi:hypothetical protein
MVPVETENFARAVDSLGDLRGKTMAELAAAIGNCDPVPAQQVFPEEWYLHTWSRRGYCLTVCFTADYTAVDINSEVGGVDAPWAEALEQAELERRIAELQAVPPWRQREYAAKLGLEEVLPAPGPLPVAPPELPAAAQPPGRPGAQPPPAVGIGGNPAGIGNVIAAGLLGIPVETASPEIICPQCRVKGYVTTSHVKKKSGISGAKATGAVLTGGLSVFATGLSRKEGVTEAHCTNCGSTWHF